MVTFCEASVSIPLMHDVPGALCVGPRHSLAVCVGPRRSIARVGARRVTLCVGPWRSLCRGPHSPCALQALSVSGPSGLCVGRSPSALRVRVRRALTLCVGSRRRCPAALCVGPRQSLCQAPALLCVGARRFSLSGPGARRAGPGALRRGPGVDIPGAQTPAVSVGGPQQSLYLGSGRYSRQSLCRAPALGVGARVRPRRSLCCPSDRGTLSLSPSGPDALCVGLRRALALSVSGSGALCVKPRHSHAVCVGPPPALCRRALCRGRRCVRPGAFCVKQPNFLLSRQEPRLFHTD